jgi:hypothetical protein
LPKKIEVHLLLADLRFQFRDVFAGRRQIRGSRPPPLFLTRQRLARPTSLPYRVSPADTEPMTPLLKTIRINPELPRQRLRALSSEHPLNRQELELSAENTASPLGHQFSPRERVPYILVSLLGGTPRLLTVSCL